MNPERRITGPGAYEPAAESAKRLELRGRASSYMADTGAALGELMLRTAPGNDVIAAELGKILADLGILRARLINLASG